MPTRRTSEPTTAERDEALCRVLENLLNNDAVLREAIERLRRVVGMIANRIFTASEYEQVFGCREFWMLGNGCDRIHRRVRALRRRAEDAQGWRFTGNFNRRHLRG